MTTFKPRGHADKRSGNAVFDLAAHKLAQAYYIANVLTGRSNDMGYFRMTACKSVKERSCLTYGQIAKRQQEYLADFVFGVDWWFDALEVFGNVRICDSFRDGYVRRIEDALEVQLADTDDSPAWAAHGSGLDPLADSRGRSVAARVCVSRLRDGAAAPD